MGSVNVEIPTEFRVAPLEICGGDSIPLYHAALILPLLPTHLNLNMTLIRRTNGRRLAPSIEAAPFFVLGFTVILKMLGFSQPRG